jgi:hypothetical protein
MKFFLKIFSLVLFFFLGSCSLTDLEDNLENPNEVSVDQLDVDLLNNKIQVDFAEFVALANTPGIELTRMMALTGGDTYPNAYQAQDFNDVWNRAYQDVLNQIKTLQSRTDGTPRVVHSGSTRVLQAYVMLTLVDLFGDVPYSQALKGNEGATNFNPGNDPGAQVYQNAITLLDEAIALLGQTVASGAGLSRDIYYGGDKVKWTALANTLKLKAYLNLSLNSSTRADVTAKINDLLTKDLIDTDAEEFTYKYGTADIPARSRHPQYRDMYKPQAGDADTYVNNSFMWNAYKQKGVEDPRWRYYFYRQVGSIAKALDDDPESVPCVFTPPPAHFGPNDVFCSFDPGFFGRDHGNNDGIPPDTRAKTCVGVYPAGGRSDVNADVATYQTVTQQGQGANGAGIQPIWLASFTEFVKAEAALTLGTTGDAGTLLAGAVQKSINRVIKFGTDKGQAVPAALSPDPAAYIAKVNELYTAAASSGDKLNVMAKEYWLALWGNGIESYNLYRRTGRPLDIQLMRIAPANTGIFLYSLPYASDFVNLNSKVDQKPDGAANKVFWDTNPDNFCK